MQASLFFLYRRSLHRDVILKVCAGARSTVLFILLLLLSTRTTVAQVGVVSTDPG